MTLAAKLDLWQKNLLDMSRVNNLLYYRASGRGAGIPFAVAAADLDPLYTRLLAGQPLKVASLPTDVDAEELEARLARLRSRTREDLNDRGIHTLYLTFGLLEWREAPQSDEPIRSPVLLVPVVIERAGVLGQYSLRRLLGEDPEINPTLREKLLHDFRAQLPSFEEIEERFEREQAQRAQANGHGYGRMPAAKLTLDRILREIESALPPQIPGRAVRRELHLGRFFFQKLVMYRDLQRNRANVLAHPLLRVLGGDGEHLPQPADLIPARDLDRRVPPHEMNEILDADSSQQEAIVAAKRGASFVLQGPPGTGKSQTIANMIAEALGQGKRVLFVSEKMAALEVVRKHLDTAGLGEFCLDLHNPRADKKAFILDLKESLHAAQTLTPENALAWQREADALQAAREELNRFVRELHLPRLALGKSAYDAYGRLAALHGVPDSAFALADVASVDHAQLERMRRALADLDAHAEVLDQYDTYPWRETTVRAYSLQLAADIRAHFGRLERELERCEAALTAMRPLLGDDQGLVTGGWAAETLRIADAAVTTPLPPRRWLDVEALPLYKAHAAEAATWSAAYHDRRERLLARYRADILACDSAALLRVLAEETPAALAALRAPGGEAPQDVAMRERDALSAHLPRARDTLDALLPAARTLAELCGLPAPATLADIADLDEIGARLLATPAPPEHWLDPAAFAHVRADVTQAAEAYVTRARMRADLQGRYMPAFFELPLADLAARFRERYASPLRVLMPGYYRDAGALRGLLRQPGPYPFARQREDVE
ncbi:MAG TPA: DUF4011 domain-containing protein, partial [Dehalococcoidia bacterium]|nr:DUF4011 domain-containing protein [Dehalococcoidia bacterium]